MTVKTLGDNVTTNANDYTGTEDNVMLSGGNANNNFAGSPNTGGGGATFLLRFTGWSNIPAGSTITDVKLTLNCAAGGPTAADLTLRRCLRPVVETTSTWNNYSTGNPWGTAGCLNDTSDRDPANIATLNYNGGFLSGPYQSNSTAALVAWAQDVLDNATTPWLYVAPAGSESWNLSAAADGNRPFLTVTFDEPGGAIALEDPVWLALEAQTNPMTVTVY